MPIEIDDIPDVDLMERFNTFTAWAEYLSVETAKALAKEERLEDELEETKALALLEGTLGLYKDRAKSVVETKELRLRYRTARNVRKLLEARFGNCSRNAGALSRELTRRTEIATFERSKRYGP
jgi:hypothetical protein